MKFIITIFCSLSFLYPILSQETIFWIDSNLKFNSVFQDIESGKFKGTVNGVLFLQKEDRLSDNIRFSRESSELNITKDVHEVYDISTKEYSGKTTSGKTTLLYSTYANSHNIEIQLPNSTFNYNTIDGCCCVIINGLNFYYNSEKEYEYLVLSFSKEIILKSDKKDTISILPNSSIVFITKR